MSEIVVDKRAIEIIESLIRDHVEGVRLFNNKFYNFQWISVKDRFPEQYGECIISDGKIVTTSYFQDGLFVGKDIDITVTHWMPLPEPPETK